ncbi:MAG: hypothetical protein A3H71_00255 [Candidatus Sungbacteria bacterium RIFCSPLOWO2_02_FULL_48_13b]|uniref:YknX-like beta-barrel domain-containing protein n=2 Tax=Candidatus Sungiibacteriota TaxID=1817917 RepID=A0A1G2LIJ8_9BACT|nr:MAG: hypothetical protein A3C12_01020 [Candidatus Sungbacteria bacterium RIFCSPHIGHO2_02_FULL_49_20]OHA11438.1 MAG: hypothetical protein A3H71_00255 [Candidatus Sungbacteria bacterium RIFCSPLOWO2_02_FULL_48_13b]
MKKIFKLLQLRTWIILTVIIVGGGIVILTTRKSATNSHLLKVERRDVVQTVSVTGSVKAASTINLEFLSSGKVVARPVGVGDKVAAGRMLMQLDTRDLDIQIKRSEAALAGSQAKLDQLKAGATDEAVHQAENIVVAAYLNGLTALDAALTKADKALSTLRADVFLPQVNKVRSDFMLALDSTTSEVENALTTADANIKEAHRLRDASAVDFPENSDAIDQTFMRTPSMLDSVRTVLVASSNLLRRVSSPIISQATVNTYAADIATARSELDTSLKSLADAVASIQSAKDALSLEQEPPRLVDLAVLEAGVKTAEADLALLGKERSDKGLYAPVVGVVTSINYEIGEIARTNTVAVVLISSGGVEIEANVPEVDISKITAGDSVKITLDALPGEEFSGVVTHIDPAETVVDGVTNYKVKIGFKAGDLRVKTGSTANLEIETLKKTNVLTLPQYGIVETDNGIFVRELVNGAPKDFPVRTGIRSSDGYVEIISGVKEGDEVVNAGLK